MFLKKIKMLPLFACVIFSQHFFALSAAAQTFPSKPIRIIVGGPAGGPPDVLSRLVGQRMSEAFGQPVIIENKSGASGLIAADMVAKAPPRRPHAAFEHLGAVGNHAVRQKNLAL